MAMCEFVSYQETANEKHLGIVTVKVYGKILLRFKWVQKKDASGCFASTPSLKVVDEEGERYIPSVIIDSRSDEDEVNSCIRKGIAASKAKPVAPKMATQASVFEGEPQQDECPF